MKVVTIMRLLAVTSPGRSDEVRGRCQKLAAALKARVNGRGHHGDVFVHYPASRRKADLPVWWMINALIRAG